MKALLSALALTCMTIHAPAYLETPNKSAQQQFQQFERDIPSLYLINGLNLSREQAGHLASLIDKTAKMEDEFSEKCERLNRSRASDVEKDAKNILSSAGKSRRTDIRNPALSARGERLKKSLLEWNSLRQKRASELDGMADDAYNVLTPSQRAIVNSFVPCFIPASDFKNPVRVGQAAGDTSAVELALERLRQAPKEETDPSVIDQVLNRLVPYVMEKRRIRYSPEEEDRVRDELSVRLRSAWQKIADMSDADFELEKKKMAGEIMPANKSGDTDDPAAVRWKIQRYILNTGLLNVMHARAKGAVTENSSSVAATPPQEKMVERDHAAATAALFKGLQLTPDQARSLIPIVRDGLKAAQQVKSDLERTMDAAIVPYTDLKMSLANGSATPKQENAARVFHSKAKDLREDKLTSELLKYQAECDKVFTAAQVSYLTDTPRASMGRGAAGHTDKIRSAAHKTLDDIRRLSPAEYAKERDTLCKALIDKCVSDGIADGSTIDPSSEAPRMAEVLDKARKMSVSNYSSKLEELIQDLCPRLTSPRKPTYTAQYHKGQPVQALPFTTRMLFSDAALEVLEKLDAERS